MQENTSQILSYEILMPNTIESTKLLAVSSEVAPT